MIIDIDKVKVEWPGRGRLVENFADCRAGGWDCRASGQDKAADAGDDERELHRYVPASKLFYFRGWTIKRRVARLKFLDATTGSTQSLPVRIADGEYMITSLKIIHFFADGAAKKCLLTGQF
jgi:hypothetical protein